MAVRALEERKSAGLDVDEVMLQKALSAVAETRKVLESLGQVPDTGARKTMKKTAPPAKRRTTGRQQGRGARGAEGDDGTWSTARTLTFYRIARAPEPAEPVVGEGFSPSARFVHNSFDSRS